MADVPEKHDARSPEPQGAHGRATRRAFLRKLGYSAPFVITLAAAPSAMAAHDSQTHPVGQPSGCSANGADCTVDLDCCSLFCDVPGGSKCMDAP